MAALLCPVNISWLCLRAALYSSSKRRDGAVKTVPPCQLRLKRRLCCLCLTIKAVLLHITEPVFPLATVLCHFDKCCCWCQNQECSGFGDGGQQWLRLVAPTPPHPRGALPDGIGSVRGAGERNYGYSVVICVAVPWVNAFEGCEEAQSTCWLICTYFWFCLGCELVFVILGFCRRSAFRVRLTPEVPIRFRILWQLVFLII